MFPSLFNAVNYSGKDLKLMNDFRKRIEAIDKMRKLPPRCPYCKSRLVEVFENEYNTYVFDSASGAYKQHEWKGEIEMFCPCCNAKLYDVFPEGVCNYVSKSLKIERIDKFIDGQKKLSGTARK